MVNYFNIYYFIYLFLAFGILLGLYFIFRNKSPKTQKIFIACFLFFSFSLHFLKLAFEPYRSGLPATIRKSTFENICAVSTLIFPFIFLSKNKLLKDYMFYFGILSGGLAMFVPTEAIGKSAFAFDTIRFYICHFSIFAMPTLMVLFKLHALDYKRIFKLPFVFYAVLCVILVNEIILMAIGFVDGNIETLLDPNIRNSSFIFGPTSQFEKFANAVFTILTPKFLTICPAGIHKGETLYWPILWLVIPAYIYLIILSILLSLPWEYKHLKQDIKNLYAKIKSFFNNKKSNKKLSPITENSNDNDTNNIDVANNISNKTNNNKNNE